MPAITEHSSTQDLQTFNCAFELLKPALKSPSIIPPKLLEKAFTSYSNSQLLAGNYTTALEIAKHYGQHVEQASAISDTERERGKSYLQFCQQFIADKTSIDSATVSDSGLMPGLSIGQGNIEPTFSNQFLDKSTYDKILSLQIKNEFFPDIFRSTDASTFQYGLYHDDMRDIFDNRHLSLTSTNVDMTFRVIEDKHFERCYTQLANLYYNKGFQTNDKSLYAKSEHVASAYLQDSIERYGEQSVEHNRAVEFNAQLSASMKEHPVYGDSTTDNSGIAF